MTNNVLQICHIPQLFYFTYTLLSYIMLRFYQMPSALFGNVSVFFILKSIFVSVPILTYNRRVVSISSFKLLSCHCTVFVYPSGVHMSLNINARVF